MESSRKIKIGQIDLTTGILTGTGTTNFIPKWNSTTGLTNSLLFDDGTNVGIGTINPTNLLHLKKSANSILLDGLKVERDPSTTSSAIFNAFGGAANIVSNGGTASAFPPILFSSSDNTITKELVRIAGDGNVGIGFSSPLEKLSVFGNIQLGLTPNQNFSFGKIVSRYNGSASFNNSAEIDFIRNEGSNGNGADIVFRNSDGTATVSENVRIKGNGSVNFGISGSFTKLSVKDIMVYGVAGTKSIFQIEDPTGGNNSSSTGFWIRHAQDNSTNADFTLGVGDSGNHIYNMGFQVNGDYRLYINRSGNVGIGTTSPQAKLEVNNTGGSYANNIVELSTRSSLLIKLADPTYGLGFGLNGTGGGIQLIQSYNTNNNIQTNLAINPYGGNVGIGTLTPNQKLQVIGKVAIGQNTDGTAIIDAYGGNALYGNNSAENGIAINSSGKIGIGTSGPSYKLHIASDTSQLGLTLSSNTNSQLVLGYGLSNYGFIQAIEQGVAYRNLCINNQGGNVLIGDTTDIGGRLQINGDATSKYNGQGLIDNSPSNRISKQCGLFPDYEQGVIILHPVYNGTLMPHYECVGTLIRRRGHNSAGLIAETYVINTATAYNVNVYNSTSTYGSAKLYTFFYQGIKYVGLLSPGASANEWGFDGYISGDGKALQNIRYFNINTSEVYNSEINNSIAEVPNYGGNVLNGNVFALGIYTNTSGSASNVGISPNGDLYRSTSSLKYKKNIEEYTKGLEEVMKLRPVIYESINEIEKGVKYSGFIAEEIDSQGLKEFVQYDVEGKPDSLAYSNMITLLTKAIQDQQKQLEELKQEITILKNK